MNKLIEYITSGKHKVIGLDGPSGAGKSTLAKMLSEKYDVTVFHTDDYFLSQEQKTPERLSLPGGNLDVERLEDEIMKNLDQERITSNRFNCKEDILQLRAPVKKKSIVLVEGVYSLHPSLLKYYDLTVFIDIDRETQLKRIEERSGSFMLERFIKEWIPLEDKYFSYFDLRNNVNLCIQLS